MTKVEPPEGDPLSVWSPAWYEALCRAQELVRLNLRDAQDQASLDVLLERADLLLTSYRPAALGRLSLSWPELHTRFPRLVQVAIVGFPGPNQNLPGHDLTYLAGRGLLTPPGLPRTLLADLGGAELAVSAGLSLLLARERGQGGAYVEVPLSDAADHFAAPLRHGMTAPGAPLGGGLPHYNLYQARGGWIAVAALEPRFQERLRRELGLKALTKDELAKAFLNRAPRGWEAWARDRDLPIEAVREPETHDDGGPGRGAGSGNRQP